jgi:hypothetical protein
LSPKTVRFLEKYKGEVKEHTWLGKESTELGGLSKVNVKRAIKPRTLDKY